ncbi:unnamed protein product [Parnassius mnemosyne]|uniref:Tc1-like transposase DDE domain-containing protein n=1 Tax=Parnassius mnemosyne TaxID=213953 RepID=A0AAV1LZK6_9NEOP
MFKNRHWIFQQDSAPAHRARSTQNWLTARGIDFIGHEDWPSSSPDLNPLDYKIWQHLEEKVCAKPHQNLESLRPSLAKAAAEIDMNVIMANTEEHQDSNPITNPYYYAQDVDKFTLNYYNRKEQLHDLPPNRIAINEERQSKSKKCYRKRNRSQESSSSSYIHIISASGGGCY